MVNLEIPTEPQLLSELFCFSVTGSCEEKAVGGVGGRRKHQCFYSWELDVPSVNLS